MCGASKKARHVQSTSVFFVFFSFIEDDFHEATYLEQATLFGADPRLCYPKIVWFH